jgi:hypothetical protein
MKRTILKALNTAFIVAVLGAGTVVHAQDEGDTRIGKLPLNLGLPTKKLVDKLYDTADFQRHLRKEHQFGNCRRAIQD